VGIENPVHIVFLAAVALIVLGPKRLPELARALGKGMREFRSAMSDGEHSEHTEHTDHALPGADGAEAAGEPEPPRV
jgi:sec-independent protein translocase protein TatA